MHNYFAFSIHKSGSTLLFNLLFNSAYRSQEIACNKSMKYVSIPDQLFNSGTPGSVLFDKHFVSPINLDEKDTIYGGFRFVPGFFNGQHLNNAGIMILVRDPRDLLTSLYYSVMKSHRVPSGEGGKVMQDFRDHVSNIAIDDFVLEQARKGNWVERLDRISSLRGRGKSWRYEDVVFDKARWYDEILDYLDLDLPQASRTELVEREDIVPASDKPDEHIRQVTPGDHRRKLRSETIEELNAIFAKAIDTWGYST